jgi:hypothetical protein
MSRALENMTPEECNDPANSKIRTIEDNLTCDTNLSHYNRNLMNTPLRQESSDIVGYPVVAVVDLTGDVRTESQYAVAHGGFSDIHIGERDQNVWEDGKVHVRKQMVSVATLPARQSNLGCYYIGGN